MPVHSQVEAQVDLVPFVQPVTGAPLHKQATELVAPDGTSYPIIDGIPRFVDSANYAAAFGLEWSVHTETQLDSRSGLNLTRERLERCLGTSVESLRGKRILEAGCGAGRFTELMVQAGAFVHAIDLSIAVEANSRNIGGRDNYVVAQASLLEPPFPKAAFDIVFCLGVLQHTPSPEASIAALYDMVQPGGMLVIDHYTWELSIVTKLAPLYRLYLKRLPPEHSKRLTDRMVELWFPIHWKVRKIRAAQALLSRISPVQVYCHTLTQLTKEQHYQWARLDTYDQLTDYYKHLRTPKQIRTILESLGSQKIEVWKGGNGVEARCWKAATPDS